MTQAPPNRHDGLRDRIVRGLGWSAGRTAANIFIQFVTIVVVSRYLSPAEVGIVAVGFGIVQLFIVVSQLGVGSAVVQRAEVGADHIGGALTIAVIGNLVCGVLMCLSAGWVANSLGLPGLATILPVLSVIFLIEPVGGLCEALLKRDMKFRNVATADLMAIGVGYSLVSIVCAASGFGIWSLVAGHITGFLVRSVLLSIGQVQRLSFRTSIAAVRDLLRYGIFVSLSGFIGRSAETLERVMIGSLLGSEAAGLFVRGRQIVEIGSTAITLPLGHVLFPALSKVQHDPPKLRRAYCNMQSLLGLISLPGFLVIVAVSPSIVPFLLGEGWSQVVVPVQALAIALFVRSHGYASAVLLGATGRVRQRALTEILHLVLVVGLVLGLARWGLDWVCLGIVSSMAVRTVILGWLAGRTLKLSSVDFMTMLTPGFVVAAILAACIGAAFLSIGDAVFALGGATAILLLAGVVMVYLLFFATRLGLPEELIALRSQYLKWPSF